MPDEQIIRHEHYNFKEQELKVTLKRGTRGDYGWEISYNGTNMGDVLQKIKEADEKLREAFLGGDACCRP